jgi:hypothetical protein
MLETGIRQIANNLIFISFGGTSTILLPISFVITFQKLVKSQIRNEKIEVYIYYMLCDNFSWDTAYFFISYQTLLAMQKE